MPNFRQLRGFIMGLNKVEDSPTTFRGGDRIAERFEGSAYFAPKGYGPYKSKPISVSRGSVYTTKLPPGTPKETIFDTASQDSTLTYHSQYKAISDYGKKKGADPKVTHEYADASAKLAGMSAAQRTRSASNYRIGTTPQLTPIMVLSRGYGDNPNEVLGGEGGSSEQAKVTKMNLLQQTGFNIGSKLLDFYRSIRANK